MVDEDAGFQVGNKVGFFGLRNKGTMIHPTIKGRIIAIGKNAKYINGVVFTVIAIQVGATVHIKAPKDLCFI